MTNLEIHHIICAVRGVPKSRETATRAIELALEHNARLTFVHVTNVEFLGSARPSMTPLRFIQKQMQDLSEFAMVVLCDRAQRRGVQDVDYIVRQGQIFQQLRLILVETRPDLLVIGQPIDDAAKSQLLDPQALSNFMIEVEKNLEIKVVPVEIDLAG